MDPFYMCQKAIGGKYLCMVKYMKGPNRRTLFQKAKM